MDLIHQSIGKALDQFDFEHNLFERWAGGKRKRLAEPVETADE